MAVALGGAAAWRHAVLLGLGLALARVAEAHVYVAQKCRGGACTDSRFPILDYDDQEQKCICRAHPCWNDGGVVHSCTEESGFPHLQFTYSANRTLGCSCNKVPQYQSVVVSRDRCPGHSCDTQDFPILDWDEEGQKCICRQHPCSSTMCHDPEKPVLIYREDVGRGGRAAPVCECIAKLAAPQKGRFRGTRMQEMGHCTFESRKESENRRD